MFEIVTDTPTDLEAEFNTYMCVPNPDNVEIEILTFGKVRSHNTKAIKSSTAIVVST